MRSLSLEVTIGQRTTWLISGLAGQSVMSGLGDSVILWSKQKQEASNWCRDLLYTNEENPERAESGDNEVFIQACREVGRGTGIVFWGTCCLWAVPWLCCMRLTRTPRSQTSLPLTGCVRPHPAQLPGLMCISFLISAKPLPASASSKWGAEVKPTPYSSFFLVFNVTSICVSCLLWAPFLCLKSQTSWCLW